MNPQQFKRSMELAHYSDMTSMLTPLINANTMSNNGQAPQVSANDTEHTMNRIKTLLERVARLDKGAISVMQVA